MDGFEDTTLTGTVEDISFQNAGNGFTVLTLSTESELLTAVGVMPGTTAGEVLTLHGSFSVHPTFGRQFKVTSAEHSLPQTTEQIYKYLSSGVIRGIGPKKAAQIIETFGDQTLDILEDEPLRLASIRGISGAQAAEIGAEFKKQHDVRTVMLGLEKYGLSPAECVCVQKELGNNAVEEVKNDPYLLCRPEIGVSFERAVEIESRLEIKPEPIFRINEGIQYILRHNCYTRGHTCIPREKLITSAAEYLGLSEAQAEEAVEGLVHSAFLKEESLNGRSFIFLPANYNAEKKIADRIHVMQQYPPAPTPTLADDIDRIEKQDGITYEELQRKAIVSAARNGLLILTGGPGTGKTTAIKGIIHLFEDQGLSVSLAAPTGRAAKRMSDVTGHEAKTIHRLLEVEWDENDRPVFRRDASNPLDCEALILDELSMVDILLLASLLDALRLGCRLVLVGDSDQLPPVGAGNVLQDLIAAGALPVVQLTQVFRQALESKIIQNAHLIVAGEMPDLQSDGRDYYHMERPYPENAARTVVELCSERLPKAYGWDSLSDIQIICPSKKGATGTVNLNRLLQAALNPKDESKSEFVSMGRIFRTGDKVMQTKNNYDVEWKSADDSGTGIFNGDIGILREVSLTDLTVTIDFDGRVAVLPAESLTDLELGYAITVHKSQGSEFKAVILPVVGIMPNLAYRNLLYTAVTRARDLLITVGTESEIRRMTENDRKAKRYSALKYFLNEG